MSQSIRRKDVLNSKYPDKTDKNKEPYSKYRNPFKGQGQIKKKSREPDGNIPTLT